MKIEKKIKSIAILGENIHNIIENNKDIVNQASRRNPWFTPDFIHKALYGITYMLKEEKLEKWISNYQLNNENKRNIGIIMAGNIPLVGFHDLLSVLLSGNLAIIKLSHNDDLLIPYIVNLLKAIDPAIGNRIFFRDSIDNAHAVIATGSDNSARYFQHTFKHLPFIIRKNRTSCCIIDGNEHEDDLRQLGDDIFSYFGLGCRNISKIYIPSDYKIHDLPPYFNAYNWITEHAKFNNNYRYLKSKYTLENKLFIDAGFFTLLEKEDLVSPISCVYYESYDNPRDLGIILDKRKLKIQCIVSRDGWYPESIPFGKAQRPEPWEYADHVDTINFLQSI